MDGQIGPSTAGTMCGWLSRKCKRGRLRSLTGGGPSWRRGYWVLDTSKRTLEEYRNEKLENLVSDVDTNDFVRVRKEGADKLQLLLVTGGDEDTITFQMESEILRNRWFDVLTLFIRSMEIKEGSKCEEDDEEDGAAKKPPLKKGLSEKKKSFAFLSRKSNLNLPAPVEETPESTATTSRFSLQNPVGQAETEQLSISAPPANPQRTTQSNTHASLRKSEGTPNQIDLTKSFMSKARNFAISINKDFIESVKKKGVHLVPGESERNKQRGAIVPVMAPEGKVEKARFKKTPKQNEMLLALVLKEFAGFFGGTLLKEVDSQSIVDLMYTVTLPKDSVVVVQGEPTDRMYVIDSGMIGVYTHDFVDRPPELEIERGPGETFGVLSLIYNQPAPFLIKTHTECTLWALPSRKFHELTASETRRRLARKVRLLERIPLIADNVDQEAIAQLADSIEFKEFHLDEYVIQQGDPLKQIIVVGEGEARLIGDGSVSHSLLQKGDVFGEWTLLGKDFKAEVSIRATSPTLTILSLEASDVEELLGPLREFIIEKWMNSRQEAALAAATPPPAVVKGSSGLIELDPSGMADAKPTKLSGTSLPSATKLSQGDAPPKLSMRKQSSMAGIGSVRSLESSSSRGLLFRSASEIAEGFSTSLLGMKMTAILKHAASYESLTKEAEQQAIEEVAREVMKNEDLARKTKAARRMTAKASGSNDGQAPPPEPLNNSTGDATALDDEDEGGGSENLDRPFIRATPLRADVNSDNVKFCALLGSGNFGKVHLVQNEEKPEEVFALKVLVRHYIVLNGWERMVQNERDAMLELSSLVQSPFLLKLYNSYTDSKNIYLLLELCESGDLYNLMRATKSKKFGEDTARFYFACVILGLEAMHSRDILYRDLKPENLMIDKTGYIKVADFGLAKKTLRTFTVCGTPEYMSPETLLSQGHGIGVDWWAAGVLLFEILHGYTPFGGGESMDVYERILEHKTPEDLAFTDEDTPVAPETKDLIRQLMHPKKNKRLGVKYPGIDGVKTHDFFKEFDWASLANLQTTPPVIPSTAHVAKLLEDSNSGKAYDPKLWGAPDDHSGWTLAF